MHAYHDLSVPIGSCKTSGVEGKKRFRQHHPPLIRKPKIEVAGTSVPAEEGSSYLTALPETNRTPSVEVDDTTATWLIGPRSVI